jgi:hypothetical protein
MQELCVFARERTRRISSRINTSSCYAPRDAYISSRIHAEFAAIDHGSFVAW